MSDNNDSIMAISCVDGFSRLMLKYDGVFHYHSVQLDRTMSEKLLPYIDEIIRKHDISIDKFDQLITITGPGSFTSLRIAAATLLGFSFAYDIRFNGLSLLDTVALTSDSNTCTVSIQAHPGRYINRSYDFDNQSFSGYSFSFEPPEGSISVIDEQFDPLTALENSQHSQLLTSPEPTYFQEPQAVLNLSNQSNYSIDRQVQS